MQAAFEASDSLALTLCDLSKAFDCISHSILTGKLEHYEVGGVALLSIKSYLENRQQVISLSGAQSKPLPIQHGVPQGSVLGPILFLVSINDLDLSGSALRFADDTTILSTGSTPAQALDNAEILFEEAKTWFSANKFKLNEGKTQKIVCTLTRHPQIETKVNLLGFTIDPKLTWSEHIEVVCRRLSRVVCLLRKLSKLVTPQYLLVVYHALFHSVLSYGLLLWGHAPNCHEVLLEQKKAIRIITFRKRLDHCKPLFIETKILTVYSHFVLLCASYVKNNIQNFPTRNTVHTYRTRHNQEIDLPFCRLSKTKNAFPTIALKIYNNLPQEIKNLETRKFDKVLKAWLVGRPLYSLDEFFKN